MIQRSELKRKLVVSAAVAVLTNLCQAQGAATDEPFVAPRPVLVPPAPASPQRIVKLPKMDTSACRLPEYPIASIRHEETGTVRLLFRISAQGDVLNATVQRSSGHERLDQAALQSLSKCRFSPAVDASGQATESLASLDYVWKLDDEPDAWSGVKIPAGTFAATTNLLSVPFDGTTAASAGLRQAVMGHIKRVAQWRASCPSIESVAVTDKPANIKPSLPPLNAENPPKDIPELWTVQQCGHSMVYVVTLRIFPDSRTTYHVMPIVQRQDERRQIDEGTSR